MPTSIAVAAAALGVGMMWWGPPGPPAPFEKLPAPLRATRPDKLPPLREEPIKPGAEPLPKRQRIFGIGVGFERSGGLGGVALNIVLPGSPAWRAGLVAGCVIAQINGESTIGRTGEECARIIREALGTVRIKYLDPALKEKTLTLEKEWIVVPE
ncbi:MAG: hypothetical protein QOE70_6020 [Chthoniobacter sp.]|jgi:hypothetical protein|nr:hypothetical protein [Chthoniobacter sp.]